MPEAFPSNIREARPGDEDSIARLMAAPAAAGLILPRSPEELTESIPCFLVADAGGVLVGCVAWRDYGQGLFEVRSLVVHPNCMGHGLGSRLVTAAVERARSQAAHSVFALTYHPGLFERQGFRIVDKEMFPQKVWADCIKCRKREHCDEIALALDLAGTRN